MEQETYIPGLHGNVNDPYAAPNAGQYNQEKNLPKRSPKGSQENQTPVVGFLYSVSKNGFPEYWPLYIGQNRIGKNVDMDICLREGSISDHHANVNIKKMRSKDGRLIATIVDVGSKNGIMINDQELDYDRHDLKSHDILTVGLNYKLIFILVDPVEYGLGAEENFVALDEGEKKGQESPVTPPSPYGNPYDNVTPLRDETINVQGGIGGLNAGGTRIM